MVAMSIFFIGIIASKTRVASPPPAASASVSARGVICEERPQRSLHQPHWLSLPPLPTIATGNPQNGELHHQFVALLAGRVVTGRLVNSGHFAVRKGGGVEARRLMRVLVEPEADPILWLHVRVLPPRR
jgi:hypothetical protein